MSQSGFKNSGRRGAVQLARMSSFEEAEAEAKATKETAADKKVVRDFLRRMPIMERLGSWQSEFNWYLTKEANPVAHERCLPDYCYNIFEKMRQVTFKAMPKFDDMITVTSGMDALKACKTIEDTKKVIRIDWVRMGIILGIGKRAMRFVEMEAENTLKREGVWGMVPNNGVADLALVFDRSRLEKMANAGGIKDVGRGLEQILIENTSAYLEKLPSMIDNMVKLAYLWSPDALADLHKGMAVGMNEFLGADGQLVEESVRQNIYDFLLQAWPEIKAMLDSKPRKTVTDLHNWMQPFMRQDMCNRVDLDYLRNVCGPLPKGIGLKLRPLSSRSTRFI